MRDEFDAKWMALRTGFIARLPRYMADIELHLAACASEDWRNALTALFHIAHNLAGSGATFGFDALARAARKAEIRIETAIKSATPLDGATTAPITRALRRLTRVAGSVIAASPVDTSHGGPA